MAMSDVLETGHIYFFYRPRVQREEARGLDDIQRFHIILSPRGKLIWRLVTVGRKRLPEVGGGRERAWAFVDTVGDTPEAVKDVLERQIYDTKTRGERVLPEARPAGEGVYALVGHGSHTHLAYELAFPRAPGDVQEDLNIEEQGSYIVTVRNPDAPAPAWVGLRSRSGADLPPELQERFRGRRFAELSPAFLDFPGVELVLIGATNTPEEELGITLEPREEGETEAAIFEDLKLERDRYPLDPLFRGEWR
jgi:hypothetical protein